MNKNIVSLAYLTSLFCLIFGALSFILHRPNANLFLTTGMAGVLIFTVMALYEIHSSKRIQTPEKLLWTLGFFLINAVTGIIYFLGYRKNIVRLPHN